MIEVETVGDENQDAAAVTLASAARCRGVALEQFSLLVERARLVR